MRHSVIEESHSFLNPARRLSGSVEGPHEAESDSSALYVCFSSWEYGELLLGIRCWEYSKYTGSGTGGVEGSEVELPKERLVVVGVGWLCGNGDGRRGGAMSVP